MSFQGIADSEDDSDDTDSDDSGDEGEDKGAIIVMLLVCEGHECKKAAKEKWNVQKTEAMKKKW